jgi:hypothetical protein
MASGVLGGRGWRGIAARLVFAVVVIGQITILYRGYDDPHKRFAFQPFGESTTWKARIVRVLADGRRLPIERGWHGYSWPDLVRHRGLAWHKQFRHADSGAASILDFLQHALDWVADHTPDDWDTAYYEAHVTYVRNQRPPITVTLRSKTRAIEGATAP